MAKESPDPHTSLETSFRRFSIASIGSSCSLISPAPSVHSLNSTGSIEGGVPTTPWPSQTPRPRPSQNISPFWKQFPSFAPSPTASFKHEFSRLATQLGWGTKQRRGRMREALSAEILFFYGNDICVSNLEKWQALCRDVRVEDVPASIKGCKKALHKVHVNIFDLIDYRRNPEKELVRFESYKAFCRNMAQKGNRVPRDCAKSGGVVKGLLKKM